MNIEVNNIKIHYEVIGNGKPIILLNPNSVNTGLMKFIAIKTYDINGIVSTHVETVVLLSKLQNWQHIEIEKKNSF